MMMDVIVETTSNSDPMIIIDLHQSDGDQPSGVSDNDRIHFEMGGAIERLTKFCC